MDELLHQRIGAGAHLLGRALGGNAAGPQNHHMVGHAEGFFQIVGDQDRWSGPWHR
jgi:hypothetical protein